ncbi:MAG TPA: winged helix DNA-binding domain-containing protein [Thermoleophilaceae bacterium]|nr:winged helix DNA-binding domain-containing protein [Thermoleophilaceae bacterium]
MADAKGAADLARSRAAAQLLHRQKRRSPAEIVRHLLAVQAQDFASVPLALRARSKGLARADVHAALDSGELVISWLNRGTLHLVHRDDFAWLRALTAPTIATANKRRLAQEGVTNPERGVRAIAKALEGGPLPRKQIGEQSSFKGPALTHLLLAATLSGLIVRGPLRGSEQTFTLVADHLGTLPKVDREKALAELGQRYAKGHSPATDADLAYWSGLPLRDVAVPRTRGARPLQAGDSLRLLPPFDPYILGWKDRSFAIPDSLTKRVMPGGGMFRAVVLVDGRVTGTWSRAGGRVVVDAPDADGIGAEAADVERFLAD